MNNYIDYYNYLNNLNQNARTLLIKCLKWVVIKVLI